MMLKMLKSICFVGLMSVGLMACDGVPRDTKQTTQSTPHNAYEGLALTSKEVAPVSLQYNAASAPQTVYYYDAQGNRQPEASENGYYRQILGQTADGRTVAQDFYQHNQQAQTSPFVIRAESNPQVFDKSVLDSRVIWYDEKGEVNSVAEFKAGEQVGWLDVYDYNQLILQLKDNPTGIDLRFFSHDDKLWGDAHLHRNLNTGKITLASLTFFHPNGQILSTVEVNEQGQPTGVKTYDPQGKVVAAEQNAKLNEIMLRRFAVLIRKLPQLMAR